MQPPLCCTFHLLLQSSSTPLFCWLLFCHFSIGNAIVVVVVIAVVVVVMSLSSWWSLPAINTVSNLFVPVVFWLLCWAIIMAAALSLQLATNVRAWLPPSLHQRQWHHCCCCRVPHLVTAIIFVVIPLSPLPLFILCLVDCFIFVFPSLVLTREYPSTQLPQTSIPCPLDLRPVLLLQKNDPTRSAALYNG